MVEIRKSLDAAHSLESLSVIGKTCHPTPKIKPH